ncbi:filamentous hemagglutinin, partial [Bordetella petrii]|nr:filamentous hemagglutinin [Bordetella petrii]
GTVLLGGNEVLTQRGSSVNVSGGTLDVQAGNIRQSWFRGADGRLYEVSTAPGSRLYTGLYQGYERKSERWGQTDTWYNPLVAPPSRREPGYTVGRDAGTLIVSAPTAVLEGEIEAGVFQGARQFEAPDAGLDGYLQAQDKVARRGRLALGRYAARGLVEAEAVDVRVGEIAALGERLTREADIAGRQDTLWLDAGWLNAQDLGGLELVTAGGIAIERDVALAEGGSLRLVSAQVDVDAAVTARGGGITVTNYTALDGTAQTEVTLTDEDGASNLRLGEHGVLDVRGLWSNALLEGPDERWRQAYVEGGSVTFNGTQDVTLAEGSLIDVSAGAAVRGDGTLLGGRGGDVTLRANIYRNGLADSGSRLLLGAEVRGYGVEGGGTLTVESGNEIRVGAVEMEGEDTALVLAPSLFRRGFSHYEVNGHAGLAVQDGTRVDVFMPVYRPADGFQAAASEEAGLQRWTPPLHLDDPLGRTLGQRAGASLTLKAARRDSGAAQAQALVIGTGAEVTVDPGQTLALVGGRQITVDGALRAPGGNIHILNPITTVVEGGGSIWIGENAVLDAAGRAYVASDLHGRRYGQVLSGGRVVLGSLRPDEADSNNLYPVNNLFVIVDEGAVIDVSGARAELDLGQPRPTLVAGDGGALEIRSKAGIAFDGALLASGGGQGASGGSLDVMLETSVLRGGVTVDPRYAVPRLITLTQTDGGDLPTDLQPGQDDGGLPFGAARFAADELMATGLDHLSLWSRDAILFEGDTRLDLGGSLSLTAAVLGASPDTPDIAVDLAAPYVQLAGRTETPLAGGGSNTTAFVPYFLHDDTIPLSTLTTANSRLTVAAALIDLGNGDLTFGARGGYDVAKSDKAPLDLPGFAKVAFDSQGDIRLNSASIATGKEFDFLAERIYATTHSGNAIQVGLGPEGRNGEPLEGAVLRLRRRGGGEVATPLSVFGSISLQSPRIEQGGALFAPLGSITMGSGNFSVSDRPALGPVSYFGNVQTDVIVQAGSITSISAAGLVLPYGYTVDGRDYYYNGAKVGYDLSSLNNDYMRSRINGFIRFDAASLVVQEGAVLDVSAGGELRGQGFTPGRGGSVDILNTALANAAPWHAGEQDAGVFAILPGLGDGQAPLDPALASQAQAGLQITIGEGVPGLPAGTYTLLPAAYALMPGGYRVELGSAGRYGAGVAASPAAGLYHTAVTTSNALTGRSNAVPVQATVMAADTVRRYAGYNETTLSQWVAARKAEFGDPGLMAPLVPEDVRPVEFNFADADPAADRVFAFDGGLRNAQVQGGRGGMVLFNGADYEVISQGGTKAAERVTLTDTDLNALGATLLAVGVNRVNAFGSLSPSGSSIVRSGATLKAGGVILGGLNKSGADAVVVESGATLDTRGRAAPGWSGENGFLLAPPSQGNSAFLVVSNDVMQFGAMGGQGSVRIGDGAALHAEGTVALLAPGGIDIGDIALSARDFLISMEDINIGTEAALAQAEGVMSDGWRLSQSILDGLLGLGELESFSLQTKNSINFFGPVALDTYDPDTGQSRAALRFISPAIYGLGEGGDTAIIRTDRFIWSGLGYSSGREGAPDWEVGSVAPGEVIAGGAGTGTGGFMVDANEVVFGFNGLAGDQTANATLERLMLGFGDVTFQARERITSELYSGLSVYQRRNGDDTFGGGNLTLSAPVLTGQAGSEMTYRAGGDLRVARPDNAAAVNPADLDLGGQLSLEGNRVRIDGSIVVPSGKVAVASTRDLVLADGSMIDVAGRAVDFFDVTRYSFGGTVGLDSAEGSIRQSAGSRIDVSAPHSDAGKLEANAVNGTVELTGQLIARDLKADPQGRGEGGTIRIKANALPGFVTLNRRLTEGGFDYLRGFETSQGDLTLGEEVRARHIEATANDGDLIVKGALRAGGEHAGSIYLAAANNLRVAGGATLDASGDQLKLDSHGDPIEGSNRAIINLTSRDGRLVLGNDVTLTVAAGGQSRGTIDLNARRVGGAAGNDVAVDAGENLTVNGAKRVSVNGFWTYDNAPDDPDNTGTQVIGQDYLDGIHQDSQDFIDAALANSGLQDRLAGLKAAAGKAFSLRPGVEIVSATEDGNLRIDGDLNFAQYRYGPGVDPAVYGSGTAGVFVMRAGGDLEVNGSVTDGFKLPPNTPDSSYTLDFELDPGLLDGNGRLTQDFELEENLTLRSGWNLGSVHGSGNSYLLPFELTDTLIQVSPNVLIPFDGELSSPVSLPFGATLPADIVLPVQINDLARPGTTYGPGLVPAGTTVGFVSLPAGTTIFQGSTFSVLMSFRPSVIPAGTDLQGINVIDAKEYGEDLQLETGFVLPKGFGISSFEGGEKVEQPIWPMASAMEQGTESWDVRLVAGADLASASSRAARTLPDQGDLILENSYLVSSAGGVDKAVQGLSVIRTGSGDLELIAGRDYRQESRFSVYTAGTGVAGAPALGAERTEDGTVLGGQHTEYEATAAAATALINTGGGNVLLMAGRDIHGHRSDGETGRWLWAASGTEGGPRQVWGINPGNYGLVGSGSRQYLDLLGFDGIGTLGGGNLTVTAGGDVGAHTRTAEGEVLGGVFLMVGGAGWVDGGGQRHTYGGGDLNLDVSGTLDPVFLGSTLDRGGVANLRGDVRVQAKALGDLWHTYDVASNNTDPRPDDELLLVNKRTFGGLRLVLGDARAAIRSQGDVLLNVEDPSRNGVALRTGHTEVQLFSTGGDVGIGGEGGDLPARFGALAAGGAIYGNSSSNTLRSLTADVSSGGWLEFLARDAIYGLRLSSVYDPALAGQTVAPARFYASEGDIYQLIYGYYGLSGQTAFVNLAGRPAHVRAGRDIVEYGGGFPGLSESALGHYRSTDVSLIEAGRDLIHINTQVVGPGTLELTAGRNVYQADRGWLRSVGPFSDAGAGNAQSGGADIVVNAGMGASGPDYRTLIDAYLNPANLAEPGRPLADQPGRVVKTYEEELIDWLAGRYGYATGGGTESGSATAGALAYFQALAPEQQRIFLREVYFAELRAAGREYNDPDSDRHGSYLRGRRMIEALFPKMDSEAGTSGYQGDFTMFVSEEDNPGSTPRRTSLLRTEGGGDIQMLAPGGDIVIGLEAVRPGDGDNGILTQGQGDIQLFSQGDIALGLSRIMTTYGGDILGWTNAGDINAGRGAKTTLVYTPPRRQYDALGNVTLSPATPATGAGIATLASIPEVPPGNLDLIAPLGIIDAGEAGIRFSGDANFAALQVVNAENIVGQGEVTGIPVMAAVNVGALTSASAAASSAATAAQDTVARTRAAAQKALPSIISVQILGFGTDAPAGGGTQAPPAPRSGPTSSLQRPYDSANLAQIVGLGDNIDPKHWARLTQDERRRLQQDR